MTATVPHKPAVDDRASSSLPPLRPMLAPADAAASLIDGAWWPYSRDLTAELPALTAVLDPLRGRIIPVAVNPTFWPVVPRKVPVHGHVVQVGWFRPSRPRTSFCCSPTPSAAGTCW